MKRIDVLKGIEQILVEKAYETGHISHRKDGDWQKTNNGWVRVKGSPAQSTPQAQESTPAEEDSNDWEEEDTEGYYGNSGGLRSTVYEGAYDTQISNIGNTEEDDHGNSVPNDEAVENVVRGIMQEWTGDTDDEDAVEAVHDSLKDAVLDRWSSIYEPPSSGEYGEITEEDLKESYGDDEVDYTYAKDIDYSQYDDDIKSIEFRENDDGELEPHDDDYFRVADKIYEQTNREDMSDEEADQLYDGIVDRVIDRAYELRGNKGSSYNDYLSNQDAIESYVDELDFDPDSTLDQTNREDVEAYLNDHDWDSNFQQYLEEQGFDTDSIDEDSDEYQNALNDFMDKAVTYLSDNWDYRTESDQQYEDYKDSYIENVVNEYGDKTAEEALNSWIEDYGFEDLSENNRKDFIEQFNKRIQKSAVRDMRSAPATKNMGF